MSRLTNLRTVPVAEVDGQGDLRPSLVRLKNWIEQRDYTGWEPYDYLNSPIFSSKRFTRFPLNWVIVQSGKRLGSVALRRALRIPPSKNPKALALFISGYCDLEQSGQGGYAHTQYLKTELIRLRSPNEEDYCWGYDWPYVSLRGTKMRAFTPNAIATVACGEALLDMWVVFRDAQALSIAKSVGRFIVTRLNRPVDLVDQLCFSYTPTSFSRILNSSALCCAYLARLGSLAESQEYFEISRRGMHYLAVKQREDGSWPYGEGRLQKWVDSFHTGFNLSALLAYEAATGDLSYTRTWKAGVKFYVNSFFRKDGAAKYHPHSAYPIDIHSCSQALLLLSDLATRDWEERNLTLKVLLWTEANMQSSEGFFFYQRHRWWVNRVPYMRWAQAWMFRALAHCHLMLGRTSH
jgi:hypothetical protein